MTLRINIRSFDFDGCIFNRNYHHSVTQNRLIEANEKLISNLSLEMLQEQYHEIVFMVGSNRQSLDIDTTNAEGGTGSCYPALQQLSDEFQKRVSPIKCRVDQYLLADTYGKTPKGMNFQKAIEKDKDFNFVRWLFDDSKLTVLYAQIHHAATQYPDAEIVFDFYDDRYVQRDILKGLGDFFNKNPDLVPRNVKLRLHCYAGEEVKDVATIQGTGLIDTSYEEHIHLMIHSAGLSFHGNLNTPNHILTALVKDDGLDKFKQQRLVKLNDSQHDEIYSSYADPRAEAFFKIPDSPRTERFNKIYNIGLTRTADDLDFLENCRFNIDLKKDGISPIQKHAAEGNHEAVAFLKKGGCSLPKPQKSNVDSERAFAIRKVGPYGLFNLDRGQYFNINFIGSTETNSNVYQLFHTVEVLIHNGQPWSKHVIGDWGKITLHPIVNGQKDGTTFSHEPDVAVIIPMNTQELKDYFKTCEAENKKTSSYLQIYCLCIEGSVNNQEIESTAKTLGIPVIKINANHLFIMPKDGRCGFDDREKYLNSIGVSVRDALTLICHNIENKLKTENSELISPNWISNSPSFKLVK